MWTCEQMQCNYSRVSRHQPNNVNILCHFSLITYCVAVVIRISLLSLLSLSFLLLGWCTIQIECISFAPHPPGVECHALGFRIPDSRNILRTYNDAAHIDASE
uniref:Uncharacterized protein n=1 Tax=Glossina pallidipes TaxID=7398 RepID=A0A1A9ZMD7_GLOPL